MKKTNIKRQAVFPILMMLVVTALALIGSSFAWFTVANTASVAQITTKAQSDGVRLELSKDADKYYTRSINYSTGTPKSAVFPDTLYQVSTNGKLGNGETLLKFFNSQLNGYSAQSDKEYIISKQDGTVVEDAGVLGVAPLGGKANYGEAGLTYGEAFAATTATYIAFDIYMATDRKADIFLYDGSAITAKLDGEEDTAYANDKDVLKALRVAFVYLGSTETAADVVDNVTGTPSVMIWEVAQNNPANTTYGITAASYVDGADNDVEFEPYKENATYAADSQNLFSSDELIVPQTQDIASKNALFSVAAPTGENQRVFSKLRVYIWLEGNDVDCLSKVASQDIRINLVFFAKDMTV